MGQAKKRRELEGDLYGKIPNRWHSTDSRPIINSEQNGISVVVFDKAAPNEYKQLSTLRDLLQSRGYHNLFILDIHSQRDRPYRIKCLSHLWIDEGGELRGNFIADKEPDCWGQLIADAQEHDLMQPLFDYFAETLRDAEYLLISG